MTKTQGRRQFLGASAVGLAGGLMAAAPAGIAAGKSGRGGGMPKERYMQYVNWFNANDQRFLQFYHPDVVLELGNTTLRGAKAIGDFYSEVKAHIRETVSVTHYVSDATGIAAELPTEFKVYKDWPDGYFRRPLKVGEVFRVISLGLYWMDDGKFRQIKAARYKLVNDWRMEA
jgi:hypothetical protein